MSKLNICKTLFIWFFLFSISSSFLCAQAAPPNVQTPGNNNPGAIGQVTVSKDTSKDELYAELLKQMGTQVDRVSITIMVLSVIVLLVSISAPIIIWLMERKIRRDSKEMEERLELKFQNEIMQRILAQLRDQIKSYEHLLIERLDNTVDPIEKRLMKADRLRSDMWDILFLPMKNALENQKPIKYLQGWNDFHKLQEALSQILSKDPNDICSGLGMFKNLYKAGIVPNSLWSLIILLKKQNRMNDFNTIANAEELGRIMDRRLDEEPEEMF